MAKPKRYKLQAIIKEFRGKYFFLSNFFPSPVLDYPTNEHFFQAQKTDDPIVREMIKNQPTPNKAKHVGRKIILRREWSEDEFRICSMYKGLRIKFSDAELKQKLLDTGEVELLEQNRWHDNYWGDCICENCVNKVGKNYLGKLLMLLRDELKNGG